MGRYSVRGFTAATAATGNHAIAGLWNPDADTEIRVHEIYLFRAGTTSGNPVLLQRTTTEGTAGSTVTPDADNAWEDDEAPASACRLNLAAFSVQPTLDATLFYPRMRITQVTGSAGEGVSWHFGWNDGLVVWPSEGLYLIQSSATAFSTSEVTFVWEENQG